MLQKIKFIGSVTTLYLSSIGAAVYLLSPASVFSVPVHADMPQKHTISRPATSRPTLVSGTPTRIVIPDHAIDLTVDQGVYANDGSWTLSDTHAQFAVMTAPANNHAGNTFLYGHGTDAVFGKLSHQTPTPATTAQVMTNNGWLFTYTFQESHNLTPDDTSILDDTASGPPRLTIQTCTGAWDQWRTMFVFSFQKVEKQS